ncbi:hypothetical protein QYE76_034445 [Lolium multiflorum]|uniref:Ribonuclease H1 N-terminal domain-containing protein n=1 Tax=Lolium multiflorum TaxID=4521 RepID=A0AAD8VK90_LOLMU|nr:hypothetical protein QYE76_034445 [Lolium multiflorum]
MDPKKRNFSGMKSHDRHVMMMQILPVAIRGIMDDHVRATLTGLCNFFDVITRKSISVKKLARLQEEIVLILCELEMYFPPAFFDSLEDNGMDTWYAILQMQEDIKYAYDMLLPESLRNRSGVFFYGYGLPPNDEIELRLEMSQMPTTYVVYKERVPGVYNDWEDCQRQVHHFSGNSYKGYPTRMEAEGRYARYLAGEMRDMRRNRMKTMAFVMMLIVIMVMFYVIVL